MNSRIRKGTSAVEAAVCLPVLVLVIFGAVEVSGGVFQDYDAQASAYELSKIALRSDGTCEDVQTLAANLLPQLGFVNYEIMITVQSRTVNANSVSVPVQSTFHIPKSGPVTPGLEDLPRGTLVKLTLTADRPSIAGRREFRTYLSSKVQSDCVFVKEF